MQQLQSKTMTLHRCKPSNCNVREVHSHKHLACEMSPFVNSCCPDQCQGSSILFGAWDSLYLRQRVPFFPRVMCAKFCQAQHTIQLLRPIRTVAEHQSPGPFIPCTPTPLSPVNPCAPKHRYAHRSQSGALHAWDVLHGITRRKEQFKKRRRMTSIHSSPNP